MRARAQRRAVEDLRCRRLTEASVAAKLREAIDKVVLDAGEAAAARSEGAVQRVYIAPLAASRTLGGMYAAPGCAYTFSGI